MHLTTFIPPATSSSPLFRKAVWIESLFRSRTPTESPHSKRTHTTTHPSCTLIATRRHLLQALLLLPLPLPVFALTRGLPQGAAAASLRNVVWPSEWPYVDSDFKRFDEQPDNVFYAQPRLVRHIDPGAIAALKQYYLGLLPVARDVLDVCASIESYLPAAWAGRRRVAGVGMNGEEMKGNEALSEFVVRDLNVEPKLPFGDASFDVVMCNLSIDYLTRPREVVAEMARVLRRGGRVVFSFSDRVFASKAVALWMGGGDEDHLYTVASYVHFAGGFGDVGVDDISPRWNGKCAGDPLYIVSAVRV